MPEELNAVVSGIALVVLSMIFGGIAYFLVKDYIENCCSGG